MHLVGMRKDCEVLIHVDVDKALAGLLISADVEDILK